MSRIAEEFKEVSVNFQSEIGVSLKLTEKSLLVTFTFDKNLKEKEGKCKFNSLSEYFNTMLKSDSPFFPIIDAAVMSGGRSPEIEAGIDGTLVRIPFVVELP